jgi:hypothetical protein
MNISKIVIFALALLAAPALAEETDTNDSAVLPPPEPCTQCPAEGCTCEVREENMGTWTAEYGVCIFDDCSECGEQSYVDGDCEPSMCRRWTMTNGCEPAIEYPGLISKVARINNSAGTTAEDVLGWDITYREEDGKCYSYYVAQEPLIGMTEAVEVECPLGVQAFDRYMVDFEEAIAVMHSMYCGGTFVELSLSWPLTPEVEEPLWRIKTDIGNEIIVGANCGKAECVAAE